MRNLQVSFCFLAVALLRASSLSAQGFENLVPQFGIKIGVPVTDMFSAGNTSEFSDGQTGSPYFSSVPRYEVGVSGEFKFPFHMRLEVDGLYKRAGFATTVNNSLLGPQSLSTAMNVFEIPAVLKYNVSLGHYRPFVDFGASLRHIAGVRTDDYSGNFSSISLTKNSSALYNRNSYGGVAGFGITFKRGPLEFTPEARYTRWSNQSFEAPGLGTNLNQGDVLLGISF